MLSARPSFARGVGRIRPDLDKPVQLAFLTLLGANSGFRIEFESTSHTLILTYGNFVEICGRFPLFS